MRIICFLLLTIFWTAWLSVECTADELLQDIEGWTAEVQERLEEDDSQDLRLALKLLRQARTERVAALRLERRLENAERRDNEDLAEQLQDQLEVRELNVEGLIAALELLHGKVELNEIIEELDEEDLSDLLKEARELQDFQQERIDSVRRLFRLLRQGEEDEAEELEEQLEGLEEEFVTRHRRLELQLELYWAEDEQDEEAIAELKAELSELRSGEEEDDEDDESGRRSRGSARMPDEEGPHLQPIVVTEQEVAAAAKLSVETHVVPLLRQHCFECHDSSSASGDLNLEQLITQQPLVVNRQHWDNVKQQLAIRSMPPADAPSPNDDDRRTLVAWLTHRVDRFDYSTVKQPGYENARRLTHAEYNNTIRDLLGVDLRPADRFPVDLNATSGFDNSANSLFIQPVLMERYVGAAEFVIQQTLGAAAPAVRRQRAESLILAGRSPRDAVTAFAERAWRRPLEVPEQEQLQNYFEGLVSDGRTPRDALLESLQLILVSPKFLIRMEQLPVNPRSVYRVSDYELASRLSYFLWASVPDDELLQCAADGTLRQPDVLTRQVDRLLDDDRSSTLGTIFAAQWLGFDSLDRIQPDQIDNPWATDSLIQAMKDESAMLFSALVQADLPIETLVDADFTFVNEELAKHYRMRGVQGPEMRRVSLEGTPRAGVLGHGSILAITSFPGRTSPVVRGNWILSELLGTPPPPPPPNVSQFDEELEDRESLSQREKMRLHRRNPNCYVCHNQIDPLGFALEEFEWFGRHRPRRRGRPVDARGELPDGTVVEGLSGLRQALVTQRRDDLVKQLTRKMLSYALGRQLEYYDEATVQQMIQHVEDNDRRLRALIHAVVRSDAFQMKQLPEEN